MLVRMWRNRHSGAGGNAEQCNCDGRQFGSFSQSEIVSHIVTQTFTTQNPAHRDKQKNTLQKQTKKPPAHSRL